MTESLILKNELEELARLATFIEDFCSANGLIAQEHPLQLCLDEAVTNVITHGYPEEGKYTLSVTLSVSDGFVSAVVKDQGTAYDPLGETPEADTSLALEEREIGGLGVHFMKHFMDELHYARQDENNVLTMKKKI